MSEVLKILKGKAGTARLEGKHGNLDVFRKEVLPFIIENKETYRELEKKTGIPMGFYAAAHARWRPRDFMTFLFSRNLQIAGKKEFMESAVLTMQSYLAGVPKRISLPQIIFLWERLFKIGDVWSSTNKYDDKYRVGVFAAYCLLIQADPEFAVEDEKAQMTIYCQTIKEVEVNG